MKTFRNNGAVGAMLDEYEKALHELLLVIGDVTNEELILIVDGHTEDKDCISIQNILTHIIRAGYGYVMEIRKAQGESVEYIPRRIFEEVKDYHQGLRNMFKANEKLFEDYPNLKLEETDNQKKFQARWGRPMTSSNYWNMPSYTCSDIDDKSNAFC